MKKSLVHLSYRKRADLARITTIIRRSVPQTEITVLFDSYPRADAVEDITVPGQTTCEYSSDYNILVLTRFKKMTFHPSIKKKMSSRAQPRDLLKQYHLVFFSSLFNFANNSFVSLSIGVKLPAGPSEVNKTANRVTNAPKST